MRHLIGCFFLVLLTAVASWAQDPGAIAIFARDPDLLIEYNARMIEARDRLGLSENQVRVLRVNTARWNAKDYARFGFQQTELPLASVVRLTPKGYVGALVGYPDFVERQIADPGHASERLLRRWADAAGVSVRPAEPLIRVVTMDPPSDSRLGLGREILVNVQAQPGGSATLLSSTNTSVPLPELGAGLYQGRYRVTEKEAAPVQLTVQFVSKDGFTEEKLLGNYLAEGWTAPKFVSVLPIGPDVYQVKGTAPAGALVKARCHIDMGRFLFIGYPDYDEEWQVQADERGEFTFTMDLNQADTRRSDITLEARFTAVASDPQDPTRLTEETQFSTPIRMIQYNRYYYSPFYSDFGLGWGSGWYAPGYYGRYYGRRRWCR